MGELILLDKLMNEVLDLTSKYEEQEARRNKINIFEVFGIQWNERAHSQFLGYLLDPKQSHGCGTIFLERFLSHLMDVKGIKINDVGAFGDLKQTTVFLEKKAANASGEECGFMDVFIELPNKAKVIIENKIHASDQPRQLLCYQSCHPDAVILYLTKLGRHPVDDSIKDDDRYLCSGQDFHCLSYSKDVLAWLEDVNCRIEELNRFKWMLEQYIQTIRTITNQTNYHIMNTAFDKLIGGNSNKEYYKIADKITARMLDIKFAAMEAIYTELANNVNEGQLGDFRIEKYEYGGYTVGQSDTAFVYYKNNWDFTISFNFISNLKIELNIEQRKGRVLDVETRRKIVSHFRAYKIYKSKQPGGNAICTFEADPLDEVSWSNLREEFPTVVETIVRCLEKELDRCAGSKA